MELSQKIPALVLFILFHCYQLFLNEKTKFIQPFPLMNIHFVFSAFPLQVKPQKILSHMHPTHWALISTGWALGRHVNQSMVDMPA